MKKEIIFIYLYGVEKRCGATSRLEFEYEFENDRDGTAGLNLGCQQNFKPPTLFSELASVFLPLV